MMGRKDKPIMATPAIVLFAVILKWGEAATIPRNPCPNVFQYFQNNGIVYGRVEFPNDYSWDYTLNVNMSVGIYVPEEQNIQLELRTSAHNLVLGQPVTYNIYFPIQNVIPRPTRIEFNRRVYCTSPPEPLRPGGYVTNMWSGNFFRISNPVRPPRPNSVPEIEIQRIPEVTPFFQIPALDSGSSSSGNGDGIFFTIPATSPSPFTSPTGSATPFVTPAPIATTKATADPEQCGQPLGVLSLVVNGEEIAEGQYPWLAAIMYKQNQKYRYKCSGSLVSKRHVLTAAHCVQYFKALLFPVKDLLLVFGSTNIKSYEEGQAIRAEGVKAHPDYQQNKGDADVAVITLKEPVAFTGSIGHVCLWDESVDLNGIVGASGTVVGWGVDETGKDFVPEARGITLPIVSQATCLRSNSRFANLTSTRTFCAGRRNGAGPCNGDSGAGFVMYRNGRYALRGVVSTALKDGPDCDLFNYLVFADVAKVLDWVKKEIE